MKFGSHRRRRAPTIIIVSLIDVLLVVLIFLMISTSFKKDAAPQLKLALPSSTQAQPGSAAETEPFIINVSTNAPYFFIADRPVTFAQLEHQLKNAAEKDPKIKVAIRADRNAPVGEFIRVIDAAKQARVGAINAVTEKAN